MVSRRIKSEFLKIGNRNNYNGVDVKAVRNSKALKGYLSKYITKNDDQIDGAPWHCSRLFSNLATTMCFHPADIFSFRQRTVPAQRFLI